MLKKRAVRGAGQVVVGSALAGDDLRRPASVVGELDSTGCRPATWLQP